MTSSWVQWEMLPQNGKWTLTEKDTDVNTWGPHTFTCLCTHIHTCKYVHAHTYALAGDTQKRDAMRKVLKRNIYICPLPLHWLPSRFVPDSSENSMKILALCQSIATSLEGHDFNIRIAQTPKAPTGLLSHSVEPRLLAVSSWPLCPARVSFAAIFCVLEDWIPYVLPYHKLPEAVMIHT